jgi:radical SAM protein with 4Fe4S-binding SPASM domain
MLDIDFYMKFDEIVHQVKDGQLQSKDDVYNALEAIRNKEHPIVYNIETTNRCNMRCEMCPRTTRMTRKMEDIDCDTFMCIVDQLQPHTPELWQKWKTYCEQKYGIAEDDEPSENHFFLYVISKVIQLHGYGDPLLDQHMHEYVKILHDRGFYSYFSCNPANINLNLTYKMLDAGLDYIKYSIESVNDEEHKKIRGEASNFSESYKKIQQVLAYKQEHKLNTTIVITMLNLNRAYQKDEFNKLLEAFSGLDVYVYLKSEDCQWYRQDYHQTHSIHWSEICKHPWMTMTIKSNGEAAMCMEDYNNEIVFGNVKNEFLRDIWNGMRYKDFRWQHLNVDEHIKCNYECDMKLIGELMTSKCGRQ